MLERRFAVHLRPEDVRAALGGTPGLAAVADALAGLEGWGNLRSDLDTSRVTTVEDFQSRRSRCCAASWRTGRGCATTATSTGAACASQRRVRAPPGRAVALRRGRPPAFRPPRPGRPLTGEPVACAWDPELTGAMRATGHAVEEERVVDELLADLSTS
jgi:hypothetical protein